MSGRDIESIRGPMQGIGKKIFSSWVVAGCEVPKISGGIMISRVFIAICIMLSVTAQSIIASPAMPWIPLLLLDTTSDPSGIVSDDFTSVSLDTSLWKFVDPVGDGSVIMNGTQAQIVVPSRTDHDVWTSGNLARRIMQPASGEDFEIKVKFESGLIDPFQLQGIIVEESSGNYLRFDFCADGPSTRLYAASFTNDSPIVKMNSTILSLSAEPFYMRITREGDQWTQSYSEDGTCWTAHITFSHVLYVSSAGVFAGNASLCPAHTTVEECFLNMASPFDPEDGIGTGEGPLIDIWYRTEQLFGINGIP